MRISDWSSDVCSSDLANAYYDVTGAFQLRGSLNWNRNRFGTFVGQCFSGQTADEGCVAAAQDFTGRAPTRSPDWAGNIGATYVADLGDQTLTLRSEEHTSELQSLMRISYAVFCLKKKIKKIKQMSTHNIK